MTIVIALTDVKGDTSHTITTNKPGMVLQFMKDHDHAGAMLTLRVSADDDEAVLILNELLALELAKPK